MVAKPALNLDFSGQLVPSDKPKVVIASHSVSWDAHSCHCEEDLEEN